MSVDRRDFSQVSEDDLEGLVSAGVPEGPTIEFKRRSYGASDSDVKEFLKDVSSFANTGGGHLLLGIEEAGGIATKISPLGIDPDKECARLESMMRDGIEPRLQVQVRAIAVTGGHVIAIRVLPSWFPPHRVIARKTNRIYVRGSTGAYEASLDEMRNLFTSATSARSSVLNFRDDRLHAIEAGATPIDLATEPSRLVIHVAPIAAFGAAPAQADLNAAMQLDQKFRPIASTGGFSPRVNFEGYLIGRGGDDCYGYTQLYRNGCIEAVKVGVVRDWNGKNRIPSSVIEANILEPVPGFIDGLTALGFLPPFVVAVTLQNVKGAVLGIGVESDPWNELPAIRSNELRLPLVVIESASDIRDVQRLLRPAIDSLWNSAGFIASRNFDTAGFWKKPS